MSTIIMSQNSLLSGQNTAYAIPRVYHRRHFNDVKAGNRTGAKSCAAGRMHVCGGVSGAGRLPYREVIALRSGRVHSRRGQPSCANVRLVVGGVWGVDRAGRSRPVLRQDNCWQAMSELCVQEANHRPGCLAELAGNCAVLSDARRVAEGVCRALTAAGGGQ